MAMTLRLNDEQTAALRRKAKAEHRSMQQVALAAIDAYVAQANPGRRQAVSTAELMEAFQALPPLNAQQFRDDLEQVVNDEAHFDAYERLQRPAESG